MKEGNLIIHGTSFSPHDCKIFLDGKELPYVQRVVVDVGVDHVNTATITLVHVPYIQLKTMIEQEDESMSDEAKKMLLFYSQCAARKEKKKKVK